MPRYEDLDRSKALRFGGSILAAKPLPEVDDPSIGMTPDDPSLDMTPDAPAGATPGGTQPDSDTQESNFTQFLKTLQSGAGYAGEKAYEAAQDYPIQAAHGLTMGLNIPLTAAIRTAAETRPSNIGDTLDRYKKQHQIANQELEAARARSPIGGAALEFGGSLATGTGAMNLASKLPNLAKFGVNLGLGGLYGAASAPQSTFENPSGVADTALTSATLSAAIPTTFGALGLLKKGLDKASPAISEVLLGLNPAQKELYKTYLNDPAKMKAAQQIEQEYSSDILNKAKEMEKFKTEVSKKAGVQYAQKQTNLLKDLPTSELKPLLKIDDSIRKLVNSATNEVEINPENYAYKDSTKNVLKQINAILGEDKPKSIDNMFNDILRVRRLIKAGKSNPELQGESRDIHPDVQIFDNLHSKINSLLHDETYFVTRLIKEMDADYASFKNAQANINKVLGGAKNKQVVEPQRLENLMKGKGAVATQEVAQDALNTFLSEAEKYGVTEPIEKLKFIRDQMQKATEMKRIAARSGETTGKFIESSKISSFLHPRLYLDINVGLSKLDDKLASLMRYDKTPGQSATKNIANRMAQFIIARMQSGKELSPKDFDFNFNKISQEELNK